jgi:hypothetical protein
MQRKAGVATDQTAHITRIAWLVSFVVPLVLVGLLLLLAIQPAHAATLGAGPGNAPGAPAAGSALGQPVEIEAEEPEEALEEGCKEAEGETEGEEPAEGTEAEPGEEEGEEETAPCEAASAPPAKCLLRSARAQVLVDPPQERVRLLVDYSFFAPARVTVEFRLEGRRGLLKLGQAKRKLAGRGSIRLSERLTKAELAKVRAANGFLVEFRIPAAPRSCDHLFTRHLTAKHAAHAETVWSQKR